MKSLPVSLLQSGREFMKATLLVIFFAATSLSLGLAVDLEKLASEPAAIEATGMNPAALKISDETKGWIEIPKLFEAHEATIFKPERDQLGVAEFRVVSDGFLLLACHFGYQGNQSGDWAGEALSKEEFREMGWKEIRTPGKTGGSLVQSDHRVQTIFFKRVHKGEAFRLRSNKYDPPYPILLGRTETKQTQDSVLPSDEIQGLKADAARDALLKKISGTWRFKTTGNKFYLFPNGVAVDHLGNSGIVRVSDLAKGVVRIKVLGTHYFRLTESGELSGAGIPGGSKHPAIRVDP
jgi:hypothetical protein